MQQVLTPQQFAQMGGVPINPAPPQPTQGITPAQFAQMGGIPYTPVVPRQPDLGDKTAQTFKQGGENIMKDIQNVKTAGIAPTLGHIAGDIAGTAGSFLGNILSPLIPNVAKEKIGEVSQFIDKKVNEISGMTPEIHKSLGDVFNTASLLGGKEALPNDIGTPASIASDLKTTVVDTGNTIKKTASDLNPLAEKPLTPAEMQIKLKGVADDWAKPTTINEPKYHKANEVFQKDPEVAQNAAKMGLNPFSSIEDGKYVTKDLEKQVRSDTGKLSRDFLRPALQEADYAVEKTLVKDLKPKVNDFEVTPDDAETISSRLNTRLQALERKYPEGMTLTDMLDEKITYDKNGGFNQFKSNSDTIDSIANRSISSNLRTQIIEKYPLAKEFFAEQAKNYRVADYLKALNNVKAPVSTAQTVARYVAKFGGAKLGGIFGGDVVSSFAGYQIGKVFETFLENMTNPMRDSFLKNLKITNPEAFTKVEEMLGTMETERATRLKLPAPAPLGTDKNPIITPAPSEQAQMESRARSLYQK